MPSRVVLLLFGLLPSAQSTLNAQAVTDSGTFFVRHGSDTVATEHFTRTATKLEGTLAIHNSKRTSERWTAVVAPDATLPLIDVTVSERGEGAGTEGRVTQRARVIFKDDSASVDEVGAGGLQTRLFETERGAVPYLNLSFALLEQAVRWARAAPHHTHISFFNLGGGQTISATLSQLGRDSLQLDIGNVRYHLLVDAGGRLMGGRIPAQNVVAERR